MANDNLQQQLEQMISKKVEEILETKITELRKQIIAEIKSTYMVEPHIKVKQMAEKLDYSVSHIYRLCSKKEIPHHKKVGRNYFYQSEINEWIRTGD